VAEYGTRRRRRGRGLLITLIVLLIIVVVVLVAADRLGRSYAERVISDKVAQQVSNQKATSEKPDVTIEGFPFLTQVAAGKYHEIKIELAHFSGPAGEGGKRINLPLLDIRAQDVRASLSTLQNGGNIVADSVTGTGTIDYQQLVSLIGQSGLTLADQGGKLTFSGKVQNFKVTGTATVVVSNGTVQVRFSDVNSPDLPNIPGIQALVDSYAQSLGIDVQVPALPLKLKVQKVQPEPGGIQFTAGASNVTLNSSGL
jgi:LmeA-like phospholipid-binding